MLDQDKEHQSNLLVNETPGEVKEALTGKRKFVEPEISQPVDVLEATTFFQAVDSGATN